MQDRRQFLNNLARGGILALLALVSGIMIRRWETSEECRRGYSCGNCGVSDNCPLPQATQYRSDRPGLKKNGEDGRRGK